MTTHDFLSNPILQRAVLGLFCGLLLGFSHNISRRLLEAVAAVLAVGLIFFVVTGQTDLIHQFDFTRMKAFLSQWNYEVGGLIGGWIVGYSIIERRQLRGGK